MNVQQSDITGSYRGNSGPHDKVPIPRAAPQYTNAATQYIHCVLLCCVALAAMLMVGCASTADRIEPLQELTHFPDRQYRPWVTVYGSAGRYLPGCRVQSSSWERFIYGDDPETDRLLLRNPQGMVALQRTLLVCDQGYDAVIAIDLGTSNHYRWHDRVTGPELRCPVDICADNTFVYVADTTLRAVVVYRHDGSFVRTLAGEQLSRGAPAQPVKAAGSLYTPVQVHHHERYRPTEKRLHRSQVDVRPCSVHARDGVLYVGDLAGRCIRRWSIEDDRLLPPLVPDDTQVPMVAPTGLCIAQDNILLIADAVRARVYRYSTDDEQWLDPIGRMGRRRGRFVRPKQVCTTPDGFIVVTDAGRQSVMVFDRSNVFLAEVHERPSVWPGWTMPSGLAVVDAKWFCTAGTAGAHREEDRPVHSNNSSTSSANDSDGSSPAAGLDEDTMILPPSGCFVLVSDSVGSESLTLLGVIDAQRPDSPGSVAACIRSGVRVGHRQSTIAYVNRPCRPEPQAQATRKAPKGRHTAQPEVSDEP